MKSIILILSIACCLVQSVFSQTIVSGGIYNDVTWSLANSPYIVSGNIVVFPGKTLTIEPGVEVRVQGNGFNSPGGITIEVRGNIKAVGTASAPITFKADGVITDPWSWRGILVKTSQGGDGEINYVNLSNALDGFRAEGDIAGNDTVRYNNCNFTHNSTAITAFRHAIFSNCQFTNNGLGVSMSGGGLLSLGISKCDFDSNAVAVGLVYDEVRIDSCNFRNNRNTCVASSSGSVTNSFFQGNEVCVQGSGYAVSNCTFLNNQTAVGQLTSGSVRDCYIINNNLGVELTAGGTLVNNEINNNVVGVRIWDANVTFTDNRICGNFQYNVENAADQNISLVANCFCESDSSVAEALLYDGYDDITRGLFNYALYDSTCSSVVQLVSKVNIPTGISPGSKAPIVVYPNPARDFLQVSLPAGVRKGQIRLLTLQGQVLRAVSATAFTRLEVADLPAGVYLLDFQGVDRQIVKWIKE